MNKTWFSDIEPYVFTYSKNSLVARFPDLFCATTEERVPTRFPALIIHEISQKERGQDLDNGDVNAVLSTFEARVYAETDEQCRSVTTAQVIIMKELRFNALSLPIYAIENNLYVSYARYRRFIGAGDIDITV